MATDTRRLMTDGMLAGCAAYLVSIAFFLVANVAAGLPAFYTPAVLGSVIFYGARDANSITVWAGPVLAFNGLFLVLLILLGEVTVGLTAWIANNARPPLIAALVLAIVATPIVRGAVTAAELVKIELPWQLIVPAALCTVAAMLLTVLEWDPLLLRRRTQHAKTAL